MDDSIPRVNGVSLGDAVRLIREARGMLQKDVGRRRGPSGSHISFIEHNRGHLLEETLRRVAKGLGVEAEFLEWLRTEDRSETDAKHFHDLIDALHGLMETEAEFRRRLVAFAALLSFPIPGE